MAITDFLEEELALYHKLASNESLTVARDPASIKADLDEAVSVGLFIIDRIRQRNRALSEAANAANHMVMPREEAEYLIRLYQAWLDETSKILEVIRAIAQSGHAATRSDELHVAHREVRLLGVDREANFDYDRMTRSIKDALEGRGKPLREAADEFCRRRYGHGA